MLGFYSYLSLCTSIFCTLKLTYFIIFAKDPDKDSDSMSTGSNVSLRSQPDDLAGSAATSVDDYGDQRSNNSKQLSAGMVEAKLKELTKMYNAEKE